MLQRYTESAIAAGQLAGVLGEADSTIEHQAFKKEASDETEPETAVRFLADLVASLQQRGIEYPLEAYQVSSFLTRCAGEGDAVGFVTRPIHRSSDRSSKPLHGPSWRHD
ncbi:hypothetical protein ABZX90_39820 [Streptomyces sp. NPDC002935]|uniref:hypothetical protein n=1 Tax=Streptomyces sp. NPDC002935 TaxID=3154545 RepID=UPI0033BE578E